MLMLARAGHGGRRQVGRLRIAQVAPLYESVPPKCYGGTERVVSYLTEELVRQGHQVTLFASGDSLTAAELVPCCPNALRLDRRYVDQLAHHYVMLEEVFQDTSRFDLIHFHIDYLHYPLSTRQPCPYLSTLHGRLDLPDLATLYRKYSGVPVVSISDAQRRPLPWLNWQGTVYHGLPPGLHSLRERPGKYLAFLGRISPEKRLDWAIDIARRTGLPLKIAAKISAHDEEYFKAEIQPLLRQSASFVEFLGEIGGDDKDEFLGNAYAMLFPIDWPEPFGLVMIESLACGTPVIAYRRGSVPEVVADGVTGFIVDNVAAGVRAVERTATLSRRKCRQVFEERFTADRMADDYVAIYEQIVHAKAATLPVQ